MKKNFKFMLVALLALFGFNSAWAAVGDVFEDGNYKFEITKVPNNSGNGGTVQILGLTDEAKAFKNTDGQEPYINDGVLEFPGEATLQGVKYTVTTMHSETFKDVAYYATSVTIPASLTEIPVAAFNTLTNLATINFASDSQVKRIGAQAFASTRITEFDFTNCIELEGLNDEVFVERWSNNPEVENQNVNSYITKITVPTSPKFKHINAAFRNLTELTEIVNLENSWIQEITERAFQGTKIGTTEAKPLVLPEKDLLYIDKNALKNSNVAYLEIKMGSVLSVGGCKVSYEQNNIPGSDNYGSYTYTYNTEVEVLDNLYGLDKDDLTATQQTPAKVAPLVSLKLTGTQKGKICTYAFAWCENMDGLNLEDLEYGSKAQFETSSFEGCKKVTALVINPITNNETGDYTFQENAFKDTPIASLTLKEVKTTNAVGVGAFGSKLKTVKIGTVDANNAAFAENAFKFDGVTGIKLALATGEATGEDEYLNSKDATAILIPASAFNFGAIYELEEIPAGFVYPEVTIGEIKSKGAVFTNGSLYGPVQKIEFTGDIARNGLTVGGQDNGANAGVKILAENPDFRLGSQFKTLIFDGEIGTNGIGSGAFAGFDKLETVTFNGLLAELAVASLSFDDSGKLGGAEGDPVRYIGEKDKEFVIYDVDDIENWAVNPFASDAFARAAEVQDPNEDKGAPRIIWWKVKDTNLHNEILGAIQKSIQGEEYEGTVYNTKFNVYKWVDLEMTAPEPDEVPSFLFFQDQVGDNKIAWGRYDLGSFTNEKGKYARKIFVEPDGYRWVNAYERTNMVIPRIQETTGAKVKITLYGLYYDEDDLGQVSTTYLVPLRVVNGTYQIPNDNTHLIIGKAEIQSGQFTDKDVKIYYNNVPGEVDGTFDAAWTNGLEDADEVTVEFEEKNNAVWQQLYKPEDYEMDCFYTKATEADAKTHQELWDEVKRFEGSTTDRAGKNLWVMTDPAKYKGFRVDSNPITKDNYTFIGVDWYYALLKNYQKEEAAGARVIWLDEAQATAIFGVKELNAKAAAGDGYIYNLQGVRVSNPSKGLYIQNGKKFIVK